MMVCTASLASLKLFLSSSLSLNCISPWLRCPFCLFSPVSSTAISSAHLFSYPILYSCLSCPLSFLSASPFSPTFCLLSLPFLIVTFLYLFLVPCFLLSVLHLSPLLSLPNTFPHSVSLSLVSPSHYLHPHLTSASLSVCLFPHSSPFHLISFFPP